MTNTGIDNILKLMELNGGYYWELYTAGTSPSKVAEMDKIESLDFDQAAHKLTQVFKVISNGRYKVKMKASPEPTRNQVFWETFTKGDQSSMNMAMPAISGYPQEDVERKISEALSKEREIWSKEQEVKELKRELAELKKEPVQHPFIGFLESEQGKSLLEGAIGELMGFIGNQSENSLKGAMPPPNSHRPAEQSHSLADTFNEMDS